MLPAFHQTQSYSQLHQLSQSLSAVNPAHLFHQQPRRFEDSTITAAGLLLDYSKNIMTPQVIDCLLQLAEERQLQTQIDNWLNGQAVNTSENRPALHHLLRASATSQWHNHPDYQLVNRQTQTMMALVEALDNGSLVGSRGTPIDTIINIGIGGSAMGVKAAYHGLASCHQHRSCRFIVNIDPANCQHQLAQLDLTSALVLVSSKSFSTLETMTNYQYVKARLVELMGDDKAQQYIYAVTASPEKAQAAGFASAQIISFPEWVGGRFSVWSAVGMPLLLSYGKDVWQKMLAGAEAMDQHLASSPLEANMPVLMALLSVWHRSFLSINNHAVLCYDHDLRFVTEHLQQLIMESNGKSVLSNGEPVHAATGEIVWGGENSNGQHSYFQWLHQANTMATSDFIVSAQTNYHQQDTHNQLVTMALGQSRSLFFGDHQDSPHAATAGGRQSNTLMLERVTPETLGSLIALYEHRTVVMAFLWGINPFDQWGVEAGKKSATALYPYLEQANKDSSQLDQSTSGLLGAIRNIHNSHQH